MVSAIRTRIVADSKGNWTLHAPVDPGVTLLELFAWLLDQRIYWMDQVPDSLVLAILALLGESPKPAQPAVTLVQLKDRASPPRPYLSVAAGTAMRRSESNPPLIFSLDQDVVLLPLSSQEIKLTVDGVDRTNDLAEGRPVHLVPIGKTSAEIKVVLPLTQKVPDTVIGKLFSLMFELAGPKGVPAEWAPDAVADVPPPATLRWSYRGKDISVPFPRVEDGTAGLRRSGVVRLPLTAGWDPEPSGADPSTVCYAVLLRIENAGFTVPPRLIRLLANFALMRHRWHRIKRPSTRNWLPLPGNVISLATVPGDSSPKEFPPIENTVLVKIKERDGNSYDWKVVPDLSLSGPADRVCIVDRARSEVRFGDGLTGRLPVAYGTDFDIEVAYEAGGGPAGNVGANLTWEAIKEKDSDPDPELGGLNVVASDGGTDSETLTAAPQRAAVTLNERNRAVTKTDYENLAKTTPGVAFRRAYAAIGHHPDFACSTVPGAVTVFVVPYAPREQTDGYLEDGAFVLAPQPDPGALKATQSRLDEAKLLGGQVFLVGPVYRPVWLGIDIAVDSTLPANLRERLVTRLQTFLDPLVGGDGGKGWPFGDPVRPSALLKQAQDVLGQAGDVIRVSIRVEGMTTAESCRDVLIAPYELVKLEKVELHTQRRTARIGGLR